MSGWKVADMETAREALRRGEMTMTLVATEGERFRLHDIAKLCTGTERLMTVVAKEASPSEKVEWIITAVGMAGDNFAITITGQKPRRRK